MAVDLRVGLLLGDTGKRAIVSANSGKELLGCRAKGVNTQRN